MAQHITRANFQQPEWCENFFRLSHSLWKRPNLWDDWNAKSENTLSIKKWEIDDWLSIDENASAMNKLTDNKIDYAILHRFVHNTSSSPEDEDEKLAEEKMSLEKCINLEN